MTEDIKRIDIKDASFFSDDAFSMPIIPVTSTSFEDEGIHVEAKRHEKTLTFIKYALQLDAIDEGWLYEQKGWMFNQLHRYREALVAFERARHLGYANDSWLNEQKSYAMDNLERDKEALDAFEQSHQLDFINEK